MAFYERKFAKPVYLAITSQIKDVVSVLKADGINAAINANEKVFINARVAKEVLSIYKTVGIWYANDKYSEITEQVKRKKKSALQQLEYKRFGFNQEWVNEIISYFKMYLLDKATVPITQTTKEFIRDLLIEGEQNGWGVDEIVRKLVSSELTAYRARLIVRTESAKAAFEGRELGKKKAPYKVTSEWIAANDHRTRHSHRLIDGVVVEPGKTFTVPVYRKVGLADMQIGVDNMIGPGDPKAHKENVINCRCTTSERVVFDENDEPVMKEGYNDIGNVLPKLPVLQPISKPEPKPTVEAGPKFVPAKTRKEAEEWALKNLNVRFADFSGLDIRVANDINKAVFNIKQVMPNIRTYGIGSAQAANREAKKRIIEAYKRSDWYKKIEENYGEKMAEKAATSFANRSVPKVGTNTLAWSTNKDSVKIPGGETVDMTDLLGVFVNEKDGKNKDALDAIIVKMRDKKWFTESANDFGYIMSHEIGHDIDKTIRFRDSEIFKAIYSNVSKMSVSDLTSQLSQYAATAGGRISHKPMEVIAESWAEFMTSPSPRALSKQIGEAMLKHYYENNTSLINQDFNSWYSQILKIVKQ